MVDRVRGAFPEEAEYYRVIFLEGYRINMKFGPFTVRKAVNISERDEDIYIKSEFLSVKKGDARIQEIWEKTFLAASLRHQVHLDIRHEEFCKLAAKITRVMVQEGAVKEERL